MSETSSSPTRLGKTGNGVDPYPSPSQYEGEVKRISSVNISDETGGLRVVLEEFPEEGIATFGKAPGNTLRAQLAQISWVPRQDIAFLLADRKKKEREERGLSGGVSSPVFARDLLDYVRDKDTGRMVCVSKGGLKSYTTTSLIMAAHMTRNTPIREGGPCFYEIIRNGNPCKFHIDAEAEYTERFHFDGDKMDRIIRADLRSFLCSVISPSIFGEKDSNGKYLTRITRVDASSRKKWSSHYIVQATFVNNFHVGCIMRKFVDFVIDKYGEPSEVIDEKNRSYVNSNPYYLQKSPVCINGRFFVCALDMGIYTSNRIFRCCGCCKAGDPKRVFVYARPGEKMEVLHAKRDLPEGRIYQPTIHEFVDAVVQDPLFNAKWIKAYGKYLVSPPDWTGGREPGSIGISRLTKFDGESDAQCTFYESLRRRVTSGEEENYSPGGGLLAPSEENGGVRLSDEWGSDDGKVDTLLRERGEIPSSTFERFDGVSIVNDRTKEKLKLTWIDGRASKRRKLHFSYPSYRSGVDGSSSVSVRKEPGFVGPSLVIDEFESNVDGESAEEFVRMVREITGKTINRGSCHFENDVFVINCSDCYCHYKGALHETPGTYITVCPSTLRIRQMCFKSTCRENVRHSLSGLWPSWNIRRGVICRSDDADELVREYKRRSKWVESTRLVTRSFYSSSFRRKKDDPNPSVISNVELIPVAKVLRFSLDVEDFVRRNKPVPQEKREEEMEEEEEEEDVYVGEEYLFRDIKDTARSELDKAMDLYYGAMYEDDSTFFARHEVRVDSAGEANEIFSSELEYGTGDRKTKMDLRLQFYHFFQE